MYLKKNNFSATIILWKKGYSKLLPFSYLFTPMKVDLLDYGSRGLCEGGELSKIP